MSFVAHWIVRVSRIVTEAVQNTEVRNPRRKGSLVKGERDAQERKNQAEETKVRPFLQ
jgi:hypothetical protein